MAAAMEDSEVGAPGADSITVLVGHNPGDLVEMSQVMNDPGRQKLRQSDYTKGGMAPTALEVRWLKIQGTQFDKVF